VDKMTNRINQKMVKSKLVDLSSELPKNYVLSHYKTGNLWHIEILKEHFNEYNCKDHIQIISSYVGSISETYNVIRVLYDVVYSIKLNEAIEN